MLLLYVESINRFLLHKVKINDDNFLTEKVLTGENVLRAAIVVLSGFLKHFHQFVSLFPVVRFHRAFPSCG